MTKTLVAVIVFCTVAYAMDELLEPSLESFVDFLFNRRPMDLPTKESAIFRAIKENVSHEVHFMGRAAAFCLVIATLFSWSLTLLIGLRLIPRIKSNDRLHR